MQRAFNIAEQDHNDFIENAAHSVEEMSKEKSQTTDQKTVDTNQKAAKEGVFGTTILGQQEDALGDGHGVRGQEDEVPCDC